MSDHDNDPELERLEKDLAQVEVEIEGCVHLYTGLRVDAYYKQIGGEGNADPIAPQLPNGMVDAEYFDRIIAEQEKAANADKAAVEARAQELQTLERSIALLNTPEGASVARLAVVHGGRDPFIEMRQRKQQLEHAMAQLKGQQAVTSGILWRQVMAWTVVDGRGFQEALSPLLQRKLALTIAHKRRIAQRMLALRAERAAAAAASK